MWTVTNSRNALTRKTIVAITVKTTDNIVLNNTSMALLNLSDSQHLNRHVICINTNNNNLLYRAMRAIKKYCYNFLPVFSCFI